MLLSYVCACMCIHLNMAGAAPWTEPAVGAVSPSRLGTKDTLTHRCICVCVCVWLGESMPPTQRCACNQPCTYTCIHIIIHVHAVVRADALYRKKIRYLAHGSVFLYVNYHGAFVCLKLRGESMVMMSDTFVFLMAYRETTRARTNLLLITFRLLMCD